MPTDKSPDVDVRFSRQFKRDLKHLSKRYRKIKSDVQPIIDDLEAGETPGDRIQGTSHPVYKVRAKNSDAQKGKSGGYRVITFFSGDDIPVFLQDVYAKNEKINLTQQEKKILKQILRSIVDIYRSNQDE